MSAKWESGDGRLRIGRRQGTLNQAMENFNGRQA
ncbi:hypothetical protein OOU_Y34scaffold00461g19 [Pyricularia oryzae Y34]|uniref:Uncharacterized protein n=2 Tax=Pyricularia oryzae TaxID=318829 RepID=A0AA97P152_PYRO3|nr:hypothetical protein OOU_Y34scaffold00461g19 [Pyricularia oryzae Y34]